MVARWPAVLAATLGILLVGPWVPARGADEKTWQALIDSARDAEAGGRLDEAERALREAMAEAERPGTARLLVARSLEEMADFYHRARRHNEAEPLYLRSIAAWEDVLGPGQPRVGIPLHNLAVLDLDRCRAEDALPLIERVSGLWAATLGPAHPDRLDALRTEAILLRRCGRGQEAAEIESRIPASAAGAAGP